MGFNTISVTGKLVKDPEYKSLENNSEMATFNLYYAEKVDEKFIHYNFRVAVFGAQCAVAMNYLKKGFHVTVSGTLKFKEYMDKEGKPRTSFEIKNPQIYLMDNREVSDQAETSIPKESGVKVLQTNGQPVNSNGAGQKQNSTRPATQNNSRYNGQYSSRR